MDQINKRWIILLLAVILFGKHVPLQAQPGDLDTGIGDPLPAQGNVYLKNGDTLTGRINLTFKYVDNFPVELKFKSADGKKRFFNAGDIMGFENYRSVPLLKKGTPVFMKMMLDGRIRIFENRSAVKYTYTQTEVTSRIDGIYFIFVPGEGLSIGPTYKTSYNVIEERTRYSSYFVMKDNGDLIKVDKENYGELFTNLFHDCPMIDEELGKDPGLENFKKFMILAEVYNELCR